MFQVMDMDVLNSKLYGKKAFNLAKGILPDKFTILFHLSWTRFLFKENINDHVRLIYSIVYRDAKQMYFTNFKFSLTSKFK